MSCHESRASASRSAASSKTCCRQRGCSARRPRQRRRIEPGGSWSRPTPTSGVRCSDRSMPAGTPVFVRSATRTTAVGCVRSSAPTFRTRNSTERSTAERDRDRDRRSPGRRNQSRLSSRRGGRSSGRTAGQPSGHRLRDRGCRPPRTGSMGKSPNGVSPDGHCRTVGRQPLAVITRDRRTTPSRCRGGRGRRRSPGRCGGRHAVSGRTPWHRGRRTVRLPRTTPTRGSRTRIPSRTRRRHRRGRDRRRPCRLAGRTVTRPSPATSIASPGTRRGSWDRRRRSLRRRGRVDANNPAIIEPVAAVLGQAEEDVCCGPQCHEIGPEQRSTQWQLRVDACMPSPR